MRKVTTDNVLYGEEVLDRIVWVDGIIQDGTMEASGKINNNIQCAHKVIIQITNWRFIITILGEEVSDHKGYSDFSWNEIREISSSPNWVIITLRDKGTFSYAQGDAEIASIKLWAFSESIKMEGSKNNPCINLRSQVNNICLECYTNATYAGKWALILRSYGAIINEGERPRRHDISKNLSIDVVKGAFARKNLENIHKKKQEKIRIIKDACGFRWIVKSENNNLTRRHENITIERWSIENDIIHLYSDGSIGKLDIKIVEISCVAKHGKDAIKISILNGQIILVNNGDYQSGGLLLNFMSNLSLIINQTKHRNIEAPTHITINNEGNNPAAKLLLTYKQIMA